MARKYFGTDGIRGTVGEGPINPDFVMRLGWAAGIVLGGGAGGKVVIGKDTRISGYMFESALEAGLSAAGVDTYLLGPMPTPGVAYLARTLHANAGIVISASHNPYQDNGIKFFSGSGCKLLDSVEEAIEQQLEQPMITVPSERLGKAFRARDAVGRYIEFCKASIPWDTSFKGYRMVLDCANGATYNIAPSVFKELGAEVDVIGDEPDGLNINQGVGSTHPEQLREAVLSSGADFGVALDGDGDRCLMIDEQGNMLDGDQLLYIIAAGRRAADSTQDRVVGTQMSNMGLEVALKRIGFSLERTRVGDRYILERLHAQGLSLGGESSGHLICLDRTTTGDGIVSALQVLQEMKRLKAPLSELVKDVPLFPQELINVPVGDSEAVLAKPALKMAVERVEGELGDEGRVLLRPSGTEPLLRVMVEGKNSALVRRLANELADQVRELVA